MIIIAWAISSFLTENPLPGLDDRSAALQAGVFLVAESAVQSLEDTQRMAQKGADALLVGTGLMAGPERLGDGEALCKELWTKI